MGKLNHAPFLLNSPKSTLIGIVRATDKVEAYGVPLFLSLERALEELKPELVVISTPHSFHYEQAKMCLEHNCHVLVEKPLCLSASEAEELVQLAERKGKLIVVGLQRRYEGVGQVFRRLVSEARLGNIELIHGLFAHRFSNENTKGWRSNPAIAGEGILDDSAFHLLDLLLYFASGKARNIKARVLDSSGRSVAHSFTCFFDTDTGVTVSACGSYLSPVNSVQEELSIWGSKGALFIRRFCKEWNAKQPDVFFKSSDGSAREDFDLELLPGGKELPLETLLSVLAGDTSRECLLTEAKYTLETHRVVDAIRGISKARGSKQSNG
jgi:predicted dehydrogenase